MRPMRQVAALLAALAAGCAAQPGSPRAACLATALEQPGLRNGVAAYTAGHERWPPLRGDACGWRMAIATAPQA